MDSWFLYLVRCADGSLYTGIATDVERRFEVHRSGKGARYLRGRGPLELVFRQPAGSRGLALQLESRVKRLAKRDKEALVREPALLRALR
ncbi:MAG: GIY-YIG nuclease family protein [Planctomycetes bacterium]|nr:GIY-YIG nuclease family protein [Planctomycetota bacterium]